MELRVQASQEATQPESCGTYLTQLENELEAKNSIIRSKLKQLKTKDDTISVFKTQKKALELELSEMKEKLETTRNEMSSLESAILKIFSPKQVQALTADEKFVHWEDDDISRAVALQSVSSKCYEYLRHTLNYPLPSQTTLKRWLTKIIVRPGIQEPVLNLIHGQFEGDSKMKRMASLAFDEMSIDDRYCYDQKDDKVYGGANQMLGM